MRIRLALSYYPDSDEMPQCIAVSDEYQEEDNGNKPWKAYTGAIADTINCGDGVVVREADIEINDQDVLKLFNVPKLRAVLQT